MLVSNKILKNDLFEKGIGGPFFVGQKFRNFKLQARNFRKEFEDVEI